MKGEEDVFEDLHEGILGEFAERASFDASEFVRHELTSGSMRVFDPKIIYQRSTACKVCGIVSERGETCSKRCTQIRRRRELIDAAICIQCKTQPAKTGAQKCIACAPGERHADPYRCADVDCHNYILPGRRSAALMKFCCPRCKNREAARILKAKRASTMSNGSRVIVVGCADEHPDVQRSVALLIGKRGTIVELSSNMATVRFYGGETRKLRHAELLNA